MVARTCLLGQESAPTKRRVVRSPLAIDAARDVRCRGKARIFERLPDSGALWLTANTTVVRSAAKAAPPWRRLPLEAIDALCIGLESIDFPGGRQSPTQSDAGSACSGAVFSM